ncbi:hypothetical protein TNCV_362381 [Trichonephila clavipes]|nr:hypothetical protein TNCV_362381 [Trichonephila clavipes]
METWRNLGDRSKLASFLTTMLATVLATLMTILATLFGEFPTLWILIEIRGEISTDIAIYDACGVFSKDDSPRLIEDETFNDRDITNNLMDYDDGQEARFFESE